MLNPCTMLLTTHSSGSNNVESIRDDPVIDLNNVRTTYEGAEFPVIRDFSLSIPKGEFVIIGGPNGAGKTTLLETIAGLLPVTRGEVRVCGLDVTRQGTRVRRKLGYVIQNFDFHPYTPFSVLEVVMMGRYGQLGCFHRQNPGDKDDALDLLNQLGLGNMAYECIGHLSGGQQQKVLIAQNLMKKPDILLLDEPFSNLDLPTRDQVCSMLRTIAESGVTIMVVSHAFDALPACAIRVVVMQNGRLSFTRICRPDEVQDTVRSGMVAS